MVPYTQFLVTKLPLHLGKPNKAWHIVGHMELMKKIANYCLSWKIVTDHGFFVQNYSISFCWALFPFRSHLSVWFVVLELHAAMLSFRLLSKRWTKWTYDFSFNEIYIHLQEKNSYYWETTSNYHAVSFNYEAERGKLEILFEDYSVF